MSIVRPPNLFRRATRLAIASLPGRLAIAAVLVGGYAWMMYAQSGLVLSHYDAKAHLVVARRVIDNLTPGWQQIGAVWLPLPHLLLLLPVQSDFLYRSGLAGSLMSLACLGITVFAYATLVLRQTGSTPGAVAAATVLTLNPSLLYLFTTPMTEPLLFAATALVVLWLYDWVDSDQNVVPPRLGALLLATAWIRYEAWAILAASGTLAGATWLRRGLPWTHIVRRACALAVWPTAAVVIFLLHSRVTIGRWFVTDGFFVPDTTYAGALIPTLLAIVQGTHTLSGTMLMAAGALGTGAMLWNGARVTSSHGWLVLGLGGAVLLPLVAFFDGHPFRIRYMTPLVAFAALSAGVAVGSLPRRVQWVASAVLIVVTVAEAPPFSPEAPMVTEAQLDRPAGVARQPVSTCLARDYRGEKILASMGSLAHYMHELSAYGFAIRDFVHEGTGVIWDVALESGPAGHVGWMLVDEVAEGGDVLAQRLRQDSTFAVGMTRTCVGGGVALYQRIPRPFGR